MTKERSSAVIVGVFFITATLFFMIGLSVYSPVINSPDYLERVHPNWLTVVSGILVELLGILSIPLIAVFLLPILRKFSQELAVTYVVFRSIEALLLMGVSICTLSLIRVSQGYLAAVGPAADGYREIGVSIQAMSHWAFVFSVGFVFPITALILNIVLYRSRLVPRVISAWGFIAAAILLAGTVLDVFELFTGMSDSTLEAILSTPIAVQEMVLALWLIFRGFNPAAIETLGSHPGD